MLLNIHGGKDTSDNWFYSLIADESGEPVRDAIVNPDIAHDGALKTLLAEPAFVGLIALKRDEIVFEAYAEDSHRHQVRSIQSISKWWLA